MYDVNGGQTSTLAELYISLYVKHVGYVIKGEYPLEFLTCFRLCRMKLVCVIPGYTPVCEVLCCLKDCCPQHTKNKKKLDRDRHYNARAE